MSGCNLINMSVSSLGLDMNLFKSPRHVSQLDFL